MATALPAALRHGLNSFYCFSSASIQHSAESIPLRSVVERVWDGMGGPCWVSGFLGGSQGVTWCPPFLLQLHAPSQQAFASALFAEGIIDNHFLAEKRVRSSKQT